MQTNKHKAIAKKMQVMQTVAAAAQAVQALQKTNAIHISHVRLHSSKRFYFVATFDSPEQCEQQYFALKHIVDGILKQYNFYCDCLTISDEHAQYISAEIPPDEGGSIASNKLSKNIQ